MKTIYLCGPIADRSDAECRDWRHFVNTIWPGACLDPMRRDYRDREHDEAAVREIVELDKEDIDRSHGLIVFYDKPSVGTSMEVLYAWQMGKPIVLVNASGREAISPWLRYHTSGKILRYEDTKLALTEACVHLWHLLK